MAKTQKGNISKWLFLGMVSLLFVALFVHNSDNGQLILTTFKKLMLQILPILILVYFIMLATNYFVNNEKLKKYMGEDAGAKGWVISIVSGILSVGPVYMWYPLMKDLQSKGVKNKFLVTFLYNRGIKLQWLPMLILYFGLKYSITLMVVMAIMSIPTGIITEKLINYTNKNK